MAENKLAKKKTQTSVKKSKNSSNFSADKNFKKVNKKDLKQGSLDKKEQEATDKIVETDAKISLNQEDSTQTEAGLNKDLADKSVIEEPKEKDLGLSEELANEKIKQIIENQNPKKRRRSTIINLCLLLVNLVFMFYIIKGLVANVGGSDLLSIIEKQGAKMWWFVGGVGIYLVYMLSQTLMYFVLIKDLTGKKRIGLSYDVAILGKYYDNVTPFAVGGQPMQIIKLASNGMSAGVSTGIPIIKMTLNSTVNIVLIALFFIFGVPKIPLTSPLNDMLLIILEILGVIGLIINVILVVFIFLLSSGKLITRSVISGILRLGYKLKIVKNYRQSFKKTLSQVAEYKASFKYLWKNKKLLLKMIGLCIVECLTYAVMPFFVVMAFAGDINMSIPLFLVVCVSKYYICSMASSFIPLPGGTGLMEIAFIFLFGVTVSENIVWALLAWRFLSYYLIILHGFIHELRHIATNLIKNRKKRKV